MYVRWTEWIPQKENKIHHIFRSEFKKKVFKIHYKNIYIFITYLFSKISIIIQSACASQKIKILHAFQINCNVISH